MDSPFLPLSSPFSYTTVSHSLFPGFLISCIIALAPVDCLSLLYLSLRTDLLCPTQVVHLSIFLSVYQSEASLSSFF